MKLRNRLKGNGLYESIKNIGAIYQRVNSRIPVKASRTTVSNFTQYEVAEKHKAQMLEFERKRSQTSAQAYHQNPR